MPFQLVVVRGRSSVKAHRLAPGTTVAGRQEGCQLQIKSSQVSRKHCEIFEEEGRLVVRDLNSSNGTFVNGEKVEGQQSVGSGDELLIGDVKFRVEELDSSGFVASATESTRVPGDPAVADSIIVHTTPEEDASELGEDLTVSVDPEMPPVAATAGTTADSTPDDVGRGPELGEDAVADFLLDLQVDDEDKL